MFRRPIAFNWRPTTFFGRVLAFALALCLFSLLLVVSVAAVSIALAALALYAGYWWYRSWRSPRSSIQRQSNGRLVIDVKPEVIDEYPVGRERDEQRSHRHY